MRLVIFSVVVVCLAAATPAAAAPDPPGEVSSVWQRVLDWIGLSALVGASDATPEPEPTEEPVTPNSPTLDPAQEPSEDSESIPGMDPDG